MLAFATSAAGFLAAGLAGPRDDHGMHAGSKRPLNHRLAIVLKAPMREINANINNVLPLFHFA